MTISYYLYALKNIQLIKNKRVKTTWKAVQYEMGWPERRIEGFTDHIALLKYGQNVYLYLKFCEHGKPFLVKQVEQKMTSAELLLLKKWVQTFLLAK